MHPIQVGEIAFNNAYRPFLFWNPYRLVRIKRPRMESYINPKCTTVKTNYINPVEKMPFYCCFAKKGIHSYRPWEDWTVQMPGTKGHISTISTTS